MSERFTIHFEPTGAGVLVSVPEIGTSTMINDLSPDAIGAAGRRLITEHLEALRKEKRPRPRKSTPRGQVSA
jgi:hypothetical protein